MLAIRLPQSIEKRLDNLARRTGRTKTFYVREAILEHLEDLEDMYLAERALKCHPQRRRADDSSERRNETSMAYNVELSAEADRELGKLGSQVGLF
jgi:RHH-type transcriptional regulator, rel operon repressor / antitoxin RelB